MFRESVLDRKLAVCIICLAFFFSAAFAFAGDLDTEGLTEGSETQEIADEILPDSQEPATETNPGSLQKSGEDVISVLLPSELPFDIVIFQGIGQGIVVSEDFMIENNSDCDITVQLQSAYLEIENRDAFFVSDEAALPETGSNIYVELLCWDMNSIETVVLTDTPTDMQYQYHLSSGESGAFRLTGAANELDNPWSDTTVRVHVAYSVAVVGAESETDDFFDGELSEIISEEAGNTSGPETANENKPYENKDDANSPEHPSEIEGTNETEQPHVVDNPSETEQPSELDNPSETDQPHELNNPSETGQPHEAEPGEKEQSVGTTSSGANSGGESATNSESDSSDSDS